jgi:hypothetical protein
MRIKSAFIISEWRSRNHSLANTVYKHGWFIQCRSKGLERDADVMLHLSLPAASAFADKIEMQGYWCWGKANADGAVQVVSFMVVVHSAL